MTQPMAARITELTANRVPFVHATVVRAQFPTSARAGDQAIVLADGSVEGFVGGHCAVGSVRTAALGALHDGESVLLRVLPEDGPDYPESPGSRVVVNPCLSGGALEIFLEPTLPSPLLHLIGETPITDALAAMAVPLGFAVERAEAGHRPVGAVAVIVATHGGAEAAAIRAALDAGMDFVGLVAGRRRSTAVLDEMELADDERKRIRTHVGLDIGARTSAEIALSIMAELVQAIRRDGLVAPEIDLAAAAAAMPTRVDEVVDPVCGMTVTPGPDTPHLTIDGQDIWFCGPGCRDQYAGSAVR
jgi:xanthine dehydrogenase accessory factor